MLLFARSRLRHKALRWFARLDPSKKKDWDLFVEALFDHYPLVEAPPEVETATPIWSETTFSPGASTMILPSDQGLGLQPKTQDERHRTRQSVPPIGRAYDPSIPGMQLGILRVVIEDGMTRPQYIWRGRDPIYSISEGYSQPVDNDQLATTIDRQEALQVCFISSTQPHPIGCLNAAYKFWDLSISCNTPDISKYELRVANGVVAINKAESYSATATATVSSIWNVLSDGFLEASLSELDLQTYHSSAGGYPVKATFKTTEVHLDTSSASVHFVMPGTPLRQDDPKLSTTPGRYEVKARLMFEPL
ncbi:hypothetical protein FRC04_004597 [Tulasnella sp. 424]|nr:hypothetical protein FRC04_004597 [Tulasnella sp. 424]